VRHRRALLATSLGASLMLAGCDYARMLRPQTLKQLNPRVVRLVDELPEVDRQNEAIVGRLFPHGGLSHADEGSDGIFRDRIYAARDQYMWYPSIITMAHGGELELEFSNDDFVTHAVFMPHIGERQLLMLPAQRAGTVRVRLDEPGLYWFGCPISNHAGRGMLGLVLVKGDVDPAAKLDRPRQKRP
jgi:PQQ system protein